MNEWMNELYWISLWPWFCHGVVTMWPGGQNVFFLCRNIAVLSASFPKKITSSRQEMLSLCFNASAVLKGEVKEDHVKYFFQSSSKTICDRSEQKQPFGWVLTNPLHVTPLRPDSTVIDGFSKLIPQRIAVEISYLLVYRFWKSINNCGAGTQWRNVWWIRQDPPKRLLLLGAVTFVSSNDWTFCFVPAAFTW